MTTLHQPARESGAPVSPLRTAGGQPVSVVHVTAEYYPYARIGGLAEAVSGLTRFQKAAGLNVAAILPLYRTVRDVDPDLEPVGQPFAVPMGSHTEEARIFRVAGAHSGPQVFFIEHPGYFNRPGIYGENAIDYPDNARRFATLVRAALEFVARRGQGLVPPPALDGRP